MATIGTLAVSVVANTAPFARGMNQARQGIARFASSARASVASVTGSVNGLLGLVGTGISAAAAVHAVGNAMERIDKLAKVADRIGISIDALGGLQHAAGLAGVETAEFNRALERMVRIVGGTSPADETFKRVAESINALPTPAARAARAVEIFGKSGAALLNVLSEGRAGIDASIEDFRKLGGSLSRLDAAQIEEANDQITRLQTALGGLATEAAVSFAPRITKAVDSLIALLNVSKEFNALDLISFQALFGGAGSVAAGANAIVDAEKAMEKNQQAAAARKAQAEKEQGIELAAEALKREAEAARKAKDAMDSLMESGRQLTSSLRTPLEIYNDTLVEAMRLLDANVIQFETYRRAIEQAANAFREATEVKKEFIAGATPGVGAVTRGSAAGFSAGQESRREMARGTIEVAKQQFAEAKQHGRFLAVIAKNTAQPVEPIQVQQVSL